MVDVRNLQELMAERLGVLGDRRGPMSTRQAASRAGGKVSYETLRLLARGDHSGKLTDDTVDGLALALDVPRSRVLAAMGRQMGQSLPPFTLPDRAHQLTRSQRKAVLSVVDAILNAAEGFAERGETQERGHLRAVAAGRRGSESEAGREARDKAAKARRDQEKP